MESEIFPFFLVIVPLFLFCSSMVKYKPIRAIYRGGLECVWVPYIMCKSVGGGRT